MSKVAAVKCGSMTELRARHVAEEEEEEEEDEEDEFNPYRENADLSEDDFWVSAGAVVVSSKDTIARFNREARAKEERKLRELQQLFADPHVARKSPRGGVEAGGPSPRCGSVIKTSPRRGSVIDLDFTKRPVPALPAPGGLPGSPTPEKKAGPLVAGTMKLLRDGKWSMCYAVCTEEKLVFGEDKAGLERPVLELQLESDVTHMPEAAQDPALGRQIRLHTLEGVLIMASFVPSESYDAWLKTISAAKKARKKKQLESSGKIALLSPRGEGSSGASPLSSYASRGSSQVDSTVASSQAKNDCVAPRASQSEVVCSECLEFFPPDQVAVLGDTHLCGKCNETLKSRPNLTKLLARNSGVAAPRQEKKSDPKAYLGIANARENWTANRPNCVSIRAGESLLVLSSVTDYFVVSTSSDEVGLVPKNKVCAFAPRVDRLAVPTCGRGRGLGSTLRGMD
jgi:hypothetical protein